MQPPTFDPGFSTEAMNAVFSADRRVEAMCRVESALAAAEAEGGVIDAALADEIVDVCAEPPPDAVALLAEGWELGSPVMALLARLRGRLSPEAGAAIHHGATTQDIVDTALMLQAVEAAAVLTAGTERIVDRLVDLGEEHRDTPTVARTMLQPARPVTFGLRCATWWGPLTRNATALRSSTALAPVQLGGPAGVPFGLGDAAEAVTAAVARRLELATRPLPWHTDRSPVIDIVAAVQGIARAVAAVATDLVLLAQPEIGEVTMRAGRSSSMPEKRNAFDAVRAIAASQACQATATLVTAGTPHQLERAAGAWHTEWFAVPVVFQTAAAAVEALASAVHTLRPNPDRMTINLGPDPDPVALAMAGDMVDTAVAAARATLSEGGADQ